MGIKNILTEHSWNIFKKSSLIQRASKSLLTKTTLENEQEIVFSMGVEGGCGCSHDIVEKEIKATLNEQYIDAIELLAVGVGHVDGNGRFILANKHLCKMLGYSKEELLELTVREISHPDDEDITDDVKQKLHSGEIESFKIEKRYLRKDNTSIWVGLTIASKKSPAGRPLYDISLIEDISSRRKAEERVQYLASYDEMTGLPNRVYFNQLLAETIKYAKRYKRTFGVLFIDLDRFKHINDSLGHAAGDQLLTEMAMRFKNRVRSSDMVARLGGDEFVILIHEVGRKQSVTAVAKDILSITRQPFMIMGKECRVTASIGVCMYPKGSEDVQTLMQNADKAMYFAKGEGKNNYQFYTDDLKAQSATRVELESHLQDALKLDEFEVHYQPRVNVKSGKICGAEALLRWNNHILGEISPVKFIPLAEEMGLIVPLGKWVLETTCQQIKKWQKCGLPPLCISVNISPRQFLDADLIPFILSTLDKADVNPTNLELEVTEGIVAQHPEQAIEKLNEVRALGVRVAIDDFGTGYSSLSQLKQFPIDTLKIDRSFIRGIPDDMENMAITEAIIVMSKLLNLTVVAEGVENEEQFNFLKRIECDEIQGFYFGKALPSSKFKKLILEKGV